MKNKFYTRTFGKWILAGEHAVLRQSPALVFPLKSKSLELNFTPLSSGHELEIDGEFGSEFRILFWSLLEKACAQANISMNTVTGRFTFRSEIPIGSGLGASAALCVALTRWFIAGGLIEKNREYEFARELENLFHGESSGVDVAVVLSEQGLHFERSGLRRNLIPKMQPIWGITDSNEKGMTYDCVLKVKRLIERDPILGRDIDLRMQKAVELCEKSLLQAEDFGILGLAEGISLAETCFRDWDLVTPHLDQLMLELKRAGAIAVKPTGSGGGGYVLSLWRSPWPEAWNTKIISCGQI